jgi:hypothetical protein
MLKNRGHLPKRRYLTRNYIKIGVRIKCHAELVSASDKINKSRDPEKVC